MMSPKIVFVVMSAVQKPETVDQLAHALAPHTVLVHHDFSQTPEFALTAKNVMFVPNPARTGWAFFGFVDGIFHSLQHAITHLDFDYLQLLSPTCLPIKPLADFEAHISGVAEAHFDCIDLLLDDDALMSVGYRALTPENSLRHRIARRFPKAYFGTSPERRDEAGVWLRSGSQKNIRSWLAMLATKALCQPSIGRHIFNPTFRPYYGSTWFGARRHIVAGMLENFARPGVRDYFSRLHIADEFLIPTLLMHLGARRGPLNHFIKKFEQAHPGNMDAHDLAQLRNCKAFFARKFPDNAAAPIRTAVLSELVGTATKPPLRRVDLPKTTANADASATVAHACAKPQSFPASRFKTG